MIQLPSKVWKNHGLALAAHFYLIQYRCLCLHGPRLQSSSSCIPPWIRIVVDAFTVFRTLHVSLACSRSYLRERSKRPLLESSREIAGPTILSSPESPTASFCLLVVLAPLRCLLTQSSTEHAFIALFDRAQLTLDHGAVARLWLTPQAASAKPVSLKASQPRGRSGWCS